VSCVPLSSRCASLAVLAVLVAAAGCAAQRPQPVSPSASIEEREPADDRIPLSLDERVAELTFLTNVLRETYAHLEVKRRQWGVDLDELFAEYRSLAERADTWTRWERVMVAFVSELHDAHLVWRRRRGPTERRRRVVRLGIETRFVGEALVVSAVWPGSHAERAGLRVGDRIVGMDGAAVEQRMGQLASLRSWSRVEAGRYDFAEEWPASRTFVDEAPRPRRVTRQRPDGGYETLSVLPEVTGRPGPKPLPFELERHGCAAVLRLRTLGLGAEALAPLKPLAAEIHASACGLVIDLRGNGGGYDKAAKTVASFFAHQPVTGAVVQVRLSSRARSARGAWRALVEDPVHRGWSRPQPVMAEAGAPRPFPGRIVAAIDAGCRSSCEMLALLLRALGATLVGERTGGSTGAPITVALPTSGARVTVPAWALLTPEGHSVEGHGVAPDETVTLKDEDLIAGRDPVLSRAVTLVTPSGASR
jgi:carboxyl-terminal processing protease